MKFVTYCENIHDLGKIKEYGRDVTEVIISSCELSRFSKVRREDLSSLLAESKKLGLRTILEWDVLITETDFSKTIEAFKQIDPSLYDGIRVQDAGVLEYALKNTEKLIQLNLENGNHNLKGIQTWVEYVQSFGKKRLDRLILSIELNKDKLNHYIKELNCQVEFLGLGRILLFYSPRKLLSALVPEEEEKKYKQVISKEYLEAIGESEESPHKGFPLVENRHGTFMFHMKHLCLLDNIYELEAMGLDFLRIDLRFGKDISLLNNILNLYAKKSDLKEFKAMYGTDVIRGYYQMNKSDVLFKKLKNHRIQRKDESYIGEVLEALKGEYLAIQIKSDIELKLDDHLKFITPEGKEYSCKIHSLKDTSLNDCSKRSKNQLAIINFMSGVWSKSQVYFFRDSI